MFLKLQEKKTVKIFPFSKDLKGQSCQFGCEIFKMVGPKMQAFCPRIKMLKGNRFILRIRAAPIRQKVPNGTFKVNFLCQKSS